MASTPTAPTPTTSATSPGLCQNGGTWEDGKCVCPEGYQGDFCEELICQNGGTWANGMCQCPPNFQGDRCETAKDIVEIKNVTMNAKVVMKTKIDREFDENLSNPSSEAFQKFNNTFQKQMQELYKDIEGFDYVNITKLSSGSIVVDYDVILKIPASSKAEEVVSVISENILTTTKNYNCSENCTGDDCICFNTNYTSMVGTDVQPLEGNLCDRVIQEEFRSFYTPFLIADGVICITRCDGRHAEPLPCVHGRCSVGREGPQCECSDKMAFWYQDSACSSRISKVGVAVGVPVAVLALVTIIFTILLLRSRRQKEQFRMKLRSRSELYSNDDGNWDVPQGFAVTNAAATWEDMETPSTSNINLEMVDTSRAMHIQRPTVVP